MRKRPTDNGWSFLIYINCCLFEIDMNENFKNLNDTFNVDGADVDLDEDLTIEEKQINTVETTKQKYRLKNHDYLLVEWQAEVERLRSVADELRQCCKVGAPPRTFEVYAGIEDKISSILDKIKQLEETETDYQVTETKEAMAKQQMELRQQNVLRRLEKDKTPSTLVQQNIQQNYMTSKDLLDMALENTNIKSNIITDEKNLPSFNLD